MGFLNHQYSYHLELHFQPFINGWLSIGWWTKSLQRKWLVGNHHFHPLKNMVVSCLGVPRRSYPISFLFLRTLQRTNISYLGKKDNRLFGVPGIYTDTHGTSQLIPVVMMSHLLLISLGQGTWRPADLLCALGHETVMDIKRQLKRRCVFW